ncbi:hypothetical protein EDD11_009921 [Mortierella claussenii]|nr:hypothetical protein EDD11_009921 [Mortierella claussenii]
MSGNNSSSNDPRFPHNQNRPFQHNNVHNAFRPPPTPVRPMHQVPFGQNSHNGFPVPGRHPIPPVRYPGQQQQQHQLPHHMNRPGAPPMVHQANQFQNMHHQQAQYQSLPAGPAFHNMAHQQNMYPIRTANDSDPVCHASVTSPTQPPSRKLPPIPAQVARSDSYDSISTSTSSNSNSALDFNTADVVQNVERANTLSKSFKDIRQKVEDLQVSSDGQESVYQKTLNKGLDAAITAAAAATTGSTLLTQGMAAANKMMDGKAQQVISNIEKNPVLSHLIQLADKLVDVGKTVPFIAPAFVILKIIIDVEQKARDADTKCNDLLERINFMISNITVLEKVKVIEPLKAVIEKMNDTLKQAASVIQTYRKQGAIARRLNMSNSQNFVQMADKITSCSHDLMLSLQIQQTGDLSVLSRAVPVDPQDEEARQFVQQHGGQAAINSNPELVEEFAKKMHLTMSDQVMDQMQSSMEDILQENQSRIETMLKENSSNTVAETIKALATEVREREAEQRLTCLQCDQVYRESANGPEACSFHTSSEQNGSFSCCGKKSPCTFSNHRMVHHCEYPYTKFYGYAYGITGYTDTTDLWAEVEEKDMLTGEVQKALVSKLIRWRSRHERIVKPTMVIHIGRINFDSPYYFQALDSAELKAINRTVRETGKSLIFRTSKDDKEYAMAEWTLDEAGVINGVRLTAKVATSDVATVKTAPIDIETVSLSGEIQQVSTSTFKIYKPAKPYQFPEIRHVGHVLRSTPLREVRQFKARTKLPIVVLPESNLMANEQGKFVRNNADKFQGTFRIFNKASPNSQTYVTLASCKAEYRFVGDKEYRDVESLSLSDVKFPTSFGPTQSLDVNFEAVVRRNEEQAALMQNCWHWAMIALHNPVRLRLTFTDIEGEECVFVQEYIHQPSKRMATKDETKDLLFLHIDDMVDSTRNVIRVTKEDDIDYVVSVNGTRLSVEDLNRIVYKAEKTGITESLLGCGRDSGQYKWDAWALVDLSCRRVYGFKVLLTEGHSRTKKTTAAMGYAPCPIYGGEEGVELEERPIRYAEEKVEFPELEPRESPVVVVDDEVDDEKVVVALSNAQAEPVIAITTAASSSVTAAMSEVAKATSSLDSAVFANSMASLDKRLESLDTNVARMATALEKLVDILSH